METSLPAASHNQLKKWTKLLQSKFRAEDGLLLAEGVKVVQELLKSDWLIEAILVLPEKTAYWEKLLSIQGQTHLSFPRRRESGNKNGLLDSPLKGASGEDPFIPVYQLSHSDFKKLSQDKEPEGIMALVKLKELPGISSLSDSATGHLLVAHEISNPQNLGALFRTARWFGFSDIVLGTNCVDWTHPKVVRASMGAVFHLSIRPNVDLPVILPEMKKKYQLIGSDVRTGIAPHPVASQTALLLGSESHGLPENLIKLADERWRIPGDDSTESLSLPQAAAIMMYELSRPEAKGQGQ